MGVVISNYPTKPNLADLTNISQLRELLGVEILGVIPSLDNVVVEEGEIGELNEKVKTFSQINLVAILI